MEDKSGAPFLTAWCDEPSTSRGTANAAMPELEHGSGELSTSEGAPDEAGDRDCVSGSSSPKPRTEYITESFDLQRRRLYEHSYSSVNQTTHSGREQFSSAEYQIQPSNSGEKSREKVVNCRPGSSCARTEELKTNVLPENTKKEKLVCAQCEYSCVGKKQLNQHVFRMHSTERPHRCMECEYSTDIKSNLKIHVLHKHSMEKPIKCSMCEYSCVIKSNMKRHILYIHSSERPLQCAECNYSCVVKERLEKHVLSKHKKIYFFRCSQCDNSYLSELRLIRHVADKHPAEEPRASPQV
ncbi:zinc finger protein 425-like [Hyalella azteca]|uniref:Protein hunchback n=1 Tax=Hyalella azteca TaxID=294128 RepID=A0A979FK43_HYAAZ|nr:zinc finger protein 425-like [Hyalella azteca]